MTLADSADSFDTGAATRALAPLRLHHVQLAMPPEREAEARAFYGDMLGLPEMPKPPHLASRGGCWFALGDTAQQVHLGVEHDFRPARKAHPAFLVPDAATLRARLEGAGVPTSDDQPLAGYVRFFTEDPFGNRIELLQEHAAAE